jgi:hypothetical protein
MKLRFRQAAASTVKLAAPAMLPLPPRRCRCRRHRAATPATPTTLLPSCCRHRQATAAASSNAAPPPRRRRHRAAAASAAALPLPPLPPCCRATRHCCASAANAVLPPTPPSPSFSSSLSLLSSSPFSSPLPLLLLVDCCLFLPLPSLLPPVSSSPILLSLEVQSLRTRGSKLRGGGDYALIIVRARASEMLSGLCKHDKNMNTEFYDFDFCACGWGCVLFRIFWAGKV